MNRTPLDQLDARRICLIKPSALGDVVQTLPVLAAIKQRWPWASVHWVVNRGFAGILEGHPQLAGVIPFDRSAKGLAAAKSMWQLTQALRRERFDLVFDLQGLLRSGLMTFATGAARRVGFAAAREGASHFYTDRISTPTGELPAVLRYWRMVLAFGGPAEPLPAQLGWRPEHQRYAAERLARLPGPLLAIHPGAQWMTKRWPPEAFAEVARRAHHELGASVVIVGGKGEEPLGAPIAAAVPAAVNLIGQTSLLELAAILKNVDVLFSGDSGPMHLAAAVGTQCVSLFTCTSPVRAGPHGAGHTILPTLVPCAASYLKTCPKLDCMRELSVSRVWPEMTRALLDASRKVG